MTDREFDALVAEKVLDLPKWLIHIDDSCPHEMTDPETGLKTGPCRSVSRYSTDVGEAFEVVGAMRSRGFTMVLTVGGHDNHIAVMFADVAAAPFPVRDIIYNADVYLNRRGLAWPGASRDRNVDVQELLAKPSVRGESGGEFDKLARWICEAALRSLEIEVPA